MRTGAFVSACALLLAVVAGQNALLNTSEAHTSDSAIQACTQTVAAIPAARGTDCDSASPGGTPVQIISNEVFRDGCATADLHVMRYIPNEGGEPLVAQWCG